MDQFIWWFGAVTLAAYGVCGAAFLCVFGMCWLVDNYFHATKAILKYAWNEGIKARAAKAEPPR